DRATTIAAAAGAMRQTTAAYKVRAPVPRASALRYAPNQSADRCDHRVKRRHVAFAAEVARVCSRARHPVDRRIGGEEQCDGRRAERSSEMRKTRVDADCDIRSRKDGRGLR